MYELNKDIIRTKKIPSMVTFVINVPDICVHTC